jgi:hypothetical protein
MLMKSVCLFNMILICIYLIMKRMIINSFSIFLKGILSIFRLAEYRFHYQASLAISSSGKSRASSSLILFLQDLPFES